MFASLTRNLLLLTGVSGAAMASGLVPEQVQQAGRQAIQSAPQALPQSWQAAPPVPVPSYDPLLATVDQWKRLLQSDNWPFSDYANFLLAHPGWPGETSRRAAAETAPNTGYDSPALVVRFFDRFAPLTGAGHARYAAALAATGNTTKAAEQARLGWRKGVLRASDEAAILGSFASALRPEDHDARLDMLLWQGQTSAAQRQLMFASPARAGTFAARIAYRLRAADAAQLGAAAEASGLQDAGFIADRSTWLRASGAAPSARTLLARPRTIAYRPAAPEKWFELLLSNARAAADEGQHSVAFDIARQVDDAYPPGVDVAQRSLGERDDYTSLMWLAGTTAMKRLARPRDAIGMFERYARGSRTATTQSKGFYWAGRAAEAAGDRATADANYGRAAALGSAFYGQLAAERLRQPLRALPPITSAGIDANTRAGFSNQEVVRVARLLGQLGRWEDQSLFVRRIADAATTPAEHVLATEFAASINRPDLGVLVGKSAIENGLGDLAGAGFPQVRVPAAAGDMWTMVHAIARQESLFNRTAVSRVGARGMMQLMPGTARETAGKLGLAYNAAALTSDTDYNIQLGSHYFGRLHATYGSYPLAVAAYNAGGGNVNKWLRANGDPRTGGVEMIDWIEAIPFSETRNYVQRVLENAVVYDLMNPAKARSRGPANLSWYLGKGQPG